MLIGCFVNLLIYAICAMIVVALFEWVIPLIFEITIPPRITMLVRLLVVVIVIAYFLGCLGVFGAGSSWDWRPYKG